MGPEFGRAVSALPRNGNSTLQTVLSHEDLERHIQDTATFSQARGMAVSPKAVRMERRERDALRIEWLM